MASITGACGAHAYARAMRLPGRTDYALRAALELAASPDGPVTTDELSHRQSIPTSYLGAILAELRKAGIVRARRGPEGGWTLARPAAEISLADVIRAIDGALTNVAGARPEHDPRACLTNSLGWPRDPRQSRHVTESKAYKVFSIGALSRRPIPGA